MIRYQQHFPQGLFYNIDHWHKLSKYTDSISSADITCQRDYIYDKRTHYSTPAAGNSGLPTAPFIQCGMEPMSNMSTALSEMLIQSHEDKIRVFPAVTDDWEGAFVLRARGAFIVSSSVKKNREVEFIGIESLKGNICNIQNPWPDCSIKITEVNTLKNVKWTVTKDKVISFKTLEGGKYIITKENSDFCKDKVFSSHKNMGPKFYKEAILGSKRDF